MSREKMDKRLLEVDEKYRFLLDGAPVSIWFTVYEEPIDITLPEMEIARLMNETGVIVEANGTVAKECGFDEVSQLIGRHWSEFVSFEENEEFYLKFVRSNYNIRGNRSVATDREGNISYNEISLLGNIVDGKLVSSFGVGGDITRRVQSEEKLQRSEEKYRSLIDDVLDSSGVGIFVLDSNFKIAWVNHALERYFGLRREDIVGKDKRQLIHKQIKDVFEDSEGFVKKVLATYENNVYVENFECHVLPGSGRQERWLEHWSQPIQSGLYAGGRVEHYTDITERKKVEEELRKSNEMYQSLMDNSLDGIWFSVFEEPIDITLPEAEIVRLMGEREGRAGSHSRGK